MVEKLYVVVIETKLGPRYFRGIKKGRVTTAYTPAGAEYNYSLKEAEEKAAALTILHKKQAWPRTFVYEN